MDTDRIIIQIKDFRFLLLFIYFSLLLERGGGRAGVQDKERGRWGIQTNKSHK